MHSSIFYIYRINSVHPPPPPPPPPPHTHNLLPYRHISLPNLPAPSLTLVNLHQCLQETHVHVHKGVNNSAGYIWFSLCWTVRNWHDIVIVWNSVCACVSMYVYICVCVCVRTCACVSCIYTIGILQEAGKEPLHIYKCPCMGKKMLQQVESRDGL